MTEEQKNAGENITPVSQKKKKEKLKRKERKISQRRTLENCFFALKMIFVGSPFFIIFYIGTSFIYGILDFLMDTYLLRRIVNGVSNGESIAGIMQYTLVLGIIVVATYLGCSVFWNITVPVQEEKVCSRIEKMLFRKAASVELACYEDPSFYDKYVKAMDEAYSRIMKVMYSLDNLIMRLINLTANSILLFIIDPVLMLFALFPLVLGIFKRLENVTNHDYQNAKKPIDRREKYVRRTFYLGEYAKEMRVGNIHLKMLKDFRDTCNEQKELIKKYGVKKAIYGYIQKFGLDVVTVLGATLYAVWSTMCIGSDNGGMSVGDCIVVLGSISTISYALNALVQNVAEFGEHALFLEDVRFFLGYETKLPSGEIIADEKGGSIKVENISFRYEGSEHDTIKNVSFEWHAGERIALVGANGSGKTTLVKLLLRFYDPTSGSITLDDRNIKELNTASYRSLYGTVFQDYKLFSMSVKENVLLRLPREGDDAIVENAIKESGIYDKIGGFAATVNIIWNVRWVLINLCERITKYAKHSLYIEKYLEFMRAEPHVTGENRSIPEFSSLELRDVSFSYDFSSNAKYKFHDEDHVPERSEQGKSVLSHVNLKISKGDKIAVVGYNGAGKTTLIKLIMRMYDPTEGEILYNCVNIKEYDPDEYRKRIGTVFQDFRIFPQALVKMSWEVNILPQMSR